MGLKELILSKVPAGEIYREMFSGWEPGKNVPCVDGEKHSDGADSVPSLSLSEKGMAFCHACGFKAGSPVEVLAKLEDVDEAEALRRLYHDHVKPLVPEDYVRGCRQKLEANPYVMARLESARGILPKTVERFELGWDGRLVIPIRDRHGLLVNVRRHDLLKKFGDAKVISYAKGYGGARLWPQEALKSGEVYIFEGELDTILASQGGLPACTVTSGANTWKDEWSQWLAGKQVVIVPDVDKPGLDGAEKRAASIRRYAASVRLVKLDLKGDKGEKDYTDWVLKKGGTPGRLRELAAAQGLLVQGESAPRAALALAAPSRSELLAPFEALTPQEQTNLDRAEAALAFMRSRGGFFKNQEGELFYAQQGGKAFRITAKSEYFLSYLSNVSPLINASTSSGKFIITHIINKAQVDSAFSRSGAWSLYADGAVYLYSGDDRIIRARNGNLELLRNAMNDDKVLLECPQSNHAFEPVLDVSIEEAVRLFWDGLISKMAVSTPDKYLLACWLLGIFFKEYTRGKPLVRLLASTAFGKSTASKMLSLMIYGDEVLQHGATTNAAIYAMAQRYPLLVFDNIETRNMYPAFEDFLLVAATGGMKAKRQLASDSGVVLEQTNCLVLTNGIEPFNKHELISRTLEVGLDLRQFGQQHFHDSKIFSGIRASRGKVLCGLLKLLSKYVVPRVRSGEVQRISREFGPHAKERFNEYMALMSIILDALWAFQPSDKYLIPHKMVAEWLKLQGDATTRQDEGTNDILYFLSTFAERRDRLEDAEVRVVREGGATKIRGTTRDLLSDFRLLARHLGIKCPWTNERQLGMRLLDADAVLRKAGWQRIQKILAGRRIYEYIKKDETLKV